MRAARNILLLLAFGALLLFAVARLLVGPSLLDDQGRLLRWAIELRAQRVLTAVTVGAALGLGGVLLQTLVRNPLASPDLVGASAGAGLALITSVYLASILGLSGALAAFAGSRLVVAGLGAGVTLLLVWRLAASGAAGAPGRVSRTADSILGRSVDPTALVLGGVMLSIVAGACIALVDHLMQAAGIPRAADVSALLLGSIRDDSSPLLTGGCLLLCAAMVVGWARAARTLDGLLLSDEEAAMLGINLSRTRTLLFLCSGTLASIAVVLAGPIAFVGLLGPHASRLLLARFGARRSSAPLHEAHLVLAPVLGACCLLLADIAARLLDFGSGRLPTGILTSLVGGPVFLYLLRSRSAENT